ncbi:hypothetical protein GGR50DRAFT_660542 [Xylaria sp. CBS 124048]|nr:hypothetical protein GGR50DRAFT_660542 [Xylaria sp. CBS 124048]
MPAPGITYSGALAKRDVNTDEEPSVFQGLKFWLSMRIPDRKSCIDTIINNGGRVVPTEKNADLLICDPSKDPAPQSYSYLLIKEAVEAGSLAAKEDYLCSSLSASTPKAKATRHRFTPEDDKLLTIFVTEKERLGEAISGTKIYREFEKQYPHHTYQSWRDRWVRKLRCMPHPPVSERAQSSQPNDALASSSRGAKAGKGVVANVKGRFTANEDALILEAIRKAIQNHRAWNGYEPYKRLANEFPQRTYDSWRERALNHVAKQNMDRIREWEREADFRPSNEEDDPADDGDEDHDAASSLMHGSPGRLPDVQRPVQNNASNYSAISTATTSPVPDPGVSITTREQFYRDYDIFLESTGTANREIPSVAGRAIALWDLWRAIRCRGGIDNADWHTISEDLGFNWVEMESVPNDVQQCYEEHLAPFAEAMMDFNDYSDGDSSEEDIADKESEDALPASPVLPALKRRSTAMDSVNKPTRPQLTPKRRKMDRNREVPSTPDDVNSTSHLRQADAPNNMTPTPVAGKRRIVVLIPSSPMNASNPGDGLPDDGLPALRPRHKRRAEPETQDFNYAAETQARADDEGPNHLDSDSQMAMTPTRQLILESDAVSARTQRHSDVLAQPESAEGIEGTPTLPRRTRDALQHDKPEAIAQKGISNFSGKVCLPPLRVPSSTRALPARTPLPTLENPKWRTLPVSHRSKAVKLTLSAKYIPMSKKTGRQDRPWSEKPRARSPLKPMEDPEAIIERFMDKGYTRAIVVQALQATSWVLGNALQVMEILKRGDPIPRRTKAVWTRRDDEALALICGEAESVKATQESLAKEERRLMAKHGNEQIALRKKYMFRGFTGDSDDEA